MGLLGDLMPTRTEKRQHLADVQRIERLEEDADTTDERYTVLSNKFDRLNGVLLGLLISVVTGTVVILVTRIGA